VVDHAHAALALHRLDDHRAHALGVERRVELGASRSTIDTPPASGWNGARYAARSVAASAPIVRPWNAPRSATILVLGARAERPRRLDLARRHRSCAPSAGRT
jgi:hypothetical protein